MTGYLTRLASRAAPSVPAPSPLRSGRETGGGDDGAADDPFEPVAPPAPSDAPHPPVAAPRAARSDGGGSPVSVPVEEPTAVPVAQPVDPVSIAGTTAPVGPRSLLERSASIAPGKPAPTLTPTDKELSREHAVAPKPMEPAAPTTGPETTDAGPTNPVRAEPAPELDPLALADSFFASLPRENRSAAPLRTAKVEPDERSPLPPEAPPAAGPAAPALKAEPPAPYPAPVPAPNLVIGSLTVEVVRSYPPGGAAAEPTAARPASRTARAPGPRPEVRRQPMARFGRHQG